MSEPLRIVHVEDSPEDVELIRYSLARQGYAPEVKRVETRAEFLVALTHDECDLILSDYTSCPPSVARSALEISASLKPEVPFIFVSGTIQEGTAIESLRNGATDYVLKDRPGRLVSVIRRALRERKEAAPAHRAGKAVAPGPAPAGCQHTGRGRGPRRQSRASQDQEPGPRLGP